MRSFTSVSHTDDSDVKDREVFVTVILCDLTIITRGEL